MGEELDGEYEDEPFEVGAGAEGLTGGAGGRGVDVVVDAGRGGDEGVWVRKVGVLPGRGEDRAPAAGALVTSGLAGGIGDEPDEDDEGGVSPGALVRPAPPCATVRAAADSAGLLEGPLLTGRVTS